MVRLLVRGILQHAPRQYWFTGQTLITKKPNFVPYTAQTSNLATCSSIMDKFSSNTSRQGAGTLDDVVSQSASGDSCTSI